MNQQISAETLETTERHRLDEAPREIPGKPSNWNPRGCRLLNVSSLIIPDPKTDAGIHDIWIVPHALERLKNRGVNDKIASLVYFYGSEKHTHGELKYCFDKEAQARMIKELGGNVYRKFAGRLDDIYVVVAHSVLIITVAHNRKGSRFH